jgi:hypothetical protein
VVNVHALIATGVNADGHREILGLDVASAEDGAGWLRVDGWRFQAFATDTRVGQLAQLEARHRAHARVEDRIRCAKNTGLARLPSRQFAINTVWVELALTAADLLAWTQTTLLEGDLAAAEPATLRYRLLHVAARITRGQRRLFVWIDQAWPCVTTAIRVEVMRRPRES